MTEVGGAGGGALAETGSSALDEWGWGPGLQTRGSPGPAEASHEQVKRQRCPILVWLGAWKWLGAEEAGSHCLPPPTCSPCIAASSVSGVQKLHGPGRSRHSLSCLQLAAQHLSACLQPPSSAGGSSTHSSAQPSTHAAPCPGLSPSCTVMISPALPHALSEGGKSTFLQMTDQKTKPARPGHRLREHSKQLRAAEI